jgi:aryl-alcohol dehydrogenase-like predicted oxidoreductase
MVSMQRRAYGKTGLEFSALAYGAMSIAQDPDIKDGVAPSLIAALDSGVNVVDTARAYGNSETLVASTLRAWRGERPIISTKLRSLSRETWRFPRPLAEAYTPQSLRASVEESLTALNVETLDIVHLHQWHYLWTHELEWLQTLEALRAEGKLRFIAVSAQDHEHDALLELVSGGRIDGVQLILNLFESRPMNGLLPLAKARGVGVIARCVFDSGGLGEPLSKEEFERRAFLKHAPYAEYQERIEALRQAFTPEPAADISELAMRFVLSAPEVSTITLGLPRKSFVESAVAAVERGPLPAEAVEAIRREHVWSKNFYEQLI